MEAIVLRAAGEGWRVGASCPVPEWRDGWAGYAELGAVAWAAIDDLDRRTDSDTWTEMERALRNDALETRSAHPALEATSALVRKMLKQTGRNHVARAPDVRMLCALEVPARLWRALREAGPCPEPPALTDRWWLVEIEHPADDEPNAVALWESGKRTGSKSCSPPFSGRERPQPAVPHGAQARPRRRPARARDGGARAESRKHTGEHPCES